MRPPFLLPSRSASKVKPPIHTPAATKEVIVFNKNASSIYLLLSGKHLLSRISYPAPFLPFSP
jgi:hypothetical protein